MKPTLTLALLAMFCAALVAADDEPLTAWRSGVQLRPVAPQEGRHTVHSYFNTCPESPDGKWVLFFAAATPNAQCGDVCIRHRATGEERVLARDINTEDAHRVACQQWVSGGRRVVYHGERDGQWFTAVVDLETGQERILARDRLAGWSQPHADIVPLYGLHWNPGPHRDLELVNVETGEIHTAITADALQQAYPEFLTQLFGDKPVSIFFPVLSPDLNRVFFKLATPAGGDARSKQASTRLGMVCYSLHDQRFLRGQTLGAPGLAPGLADHRRGWPPADRQQDRHDAADCRSAGVPRRSSLGQSRWETDRDRHDNGPAGRNGKRMGRGRRRHPRRESRAHPPL